MEGGRPLAEHLEIGISPPAKLATMSLGERQAAMAAIADAGVDHVFFADHVSFRVGAGTDGLVHAAALTQLHPTLSIYVGVYLLALRHPVAVARQIASVCELAPGRLVLGVGVGGDDRHEVEVCGVDPATRGRRTDECLEVLARLRSGEPIDFDGEFFQLEAVQVVPPPDPPVRITIGGRADAALRRTARYGDGWLGIWQTPDRFATALARIDEHAADLGRTRPFDHGLQLWCGLGEDRDEARARVAKRMEGFYRVPFDRFERYTPYGTPADLAAWLRPFVELGCRTLNLTLCGPSDEAAVEGVREVARLLRA